MHARPVALASLLLVGLAPGLAWPQPNSDTTKEELPSRAKAVVQALVKGDYTAAGADFDDVMTKALPADKLKAVWNERTARRGAFQKQVRMRLDRAGKYDIVVATCAFEKDQLDVKVVFNADKKVTGLFFLDVYQLPAYVKASAFRERAVTVGKGEWALPGALALPAGDGPFPAVVLVHGSGPHDQDETIGPNKPFRDLAGGLASRGIAVLRYEKRTEKYAKKLSQGKEPITIKEEVLDDALAAVALLRQTKEIDPKRIYVLGHSLGGSVAPRLGQEDQAIAGLIVLAGTARPLEDVMLEQLTYLATVQDEHAKERQAQLEPIRKEISRLKDAQFMAAAKPTDPVLGVPIAYWLSLRSLTPAETAAKLTQRLFVLQGERDYQVTMDDFAIWKKALATRKDAKLKSYPRLNHLFQEGEGKSRPGEYEQMRHVAQEVIEDIAAWIKER